VREMKKHGIRKSGLLITSTVVRSNIENLTKLLKGHNWAIVGSIASQIWAYYLTGSTIFCRPTDNMNIVGVDIMDIIEDNFGVLSSGFSSDDRREINFLVSYTPKFRLNVISYSSPWMIDGFDRIKIVKIWNREIPVVSMEDIIIKKLLMDRIEDEVDVINMFRAYQRYLRSLIVNNQEQNVKLSFKLMRDIIESEYAGFEDEFEERLREILKVDFELLEKFEDKPREMIKLLTV